MDYEFDFRIEKLEMADSIWQLKMQKVIYSSIEPSKTPEFYVVWILVCHIWSVNLNHWVLPKSKNFLYLRTFVSSILNFWILRSDKKIIGWHFLVNPIIFKILVGQRNSEIAGPTSLVLLKKIDFKRTA